MNCINCGAHMEGDGYKRVLHCPDAVEEDFISCEPDADSVYCRHVTDEVARALNCGAVTSIPELIKQHGAVTSIPELIKQHGNGARVARALDISELSVAKYRFDRNCEKHIIIGGKLYTVKKGNKKECGE